MNSWTLLDRVTSLDVEREIRALGNVPNTLPVFQTHFPRFPVLPGVMVLASLARLARLFMRKRTGREWAVAAVEEVRFRRFVQPGDQMDLRVALQECSAAAASVYATVYVDGRPVTSARAIRLVPAEGEGRP
jgi:3-hydroxyacyl-[acyl-carrier-protein] dehydratase